MQEVNWDLEDQHGFVVSGSTVQKAVRQRGWTPKNAFRPQAQESARV